MTPLTINPPELIERDDMVVAVDETSLEGTMVDPESCTVSTENPLEGLSVDRIILRSARRLR